MNKVSKMTKERFVKECNNDITLMSSVSGLSFDECTEMMFITYKSFAIEDMDDDEVNRIIDKLNSIEIK